MGLSTKQVSGDHHGLDWCQTLLQSGTLMELPKPSPARRQQQRQQSEPLPCPRCGSTNTKFCYYNNYNKSQPRHFCKACKRHWTKGGTLRNVPVGGARKNKRLKTSNTAAVTAAATSTTMSKGNTHTGVQSQQQCQNLPLTPGDRKNVSGILYQDLIRPPASLQHDTINNFSSKNFSGLSSIDTNPSLLSSSNSYNYTGLGLKTMEDSTITTVMPNLSSIVSQPWQVPPTSSVTDMPNYWNWDDIDTLVSTDLNIPWDDTEIKP
ncbi:hypothetical protein F0562_018479 [Nyssa sinensis]|uniref:Dof zinc finger protein n=1 Tax=Nyssa sinensis TaxID=561372 RepID=A0A5J4ZDE5_9ASTE|nr:hypothetical protein F0562_018479 [Nyssa sinensis]